MDGMFGLKKRLKSPAKVVNSTDETTRRKSLINLVSPHEVTEESLEVWRGLPLEIRQDPSWASFQIENERLHGSPLPEDETIPEFSDSDSVNEHEYQESEFITIKVPKHSKEMANTMEINSGNHAESDAEPQITFTKPSYIKKCAKIGFFVIIWILCALALASTGEKVIKGRQVAVPPNAFKYFYLPEIPLNKKFNLEFIGAFLENNFGNDTVNYLTVQFQIAELIEANDTTSVKEVKDILLPWNVPTAMPELYETSARLTQYAKFELSSHDRDLLEKPYYRIRLKLTTKNSNLPFAFQINYDHAPIEILTGTICAAIVLGTLYSLIIWEVIHRTFVAVITSTISVSILAVLGNRPTMGEIMKWMDIQPLLLLFSMMILVAILTETGVFDYLAVLAFEKTAGKIWPLIYCLCIITCTVSALLDNVTTVLLMTPITIRLCEVMELNPIPMLMGLIVHANIGGILTPIGDPPSLIIYSDAYISKHGVTFFTFIEHMAPGVILAIIQSCFYLRLIFRDNHDLRLKEPQAIKELRREITVWQRAADSLPSYTKDADLVRATLLKKVKILRHILKKKELAGPASTEVYKRTLDELKAAYPIKDKMLLFMSGFVLLFIITLFFVQSLPDIQVLPLGWVALLGVLLLLVISDKDDMDTLMSRVEWTTLLFFAGLFVTMESLARMGLNDWIGQQTENIILFVNEDFRLALAIFIILWVSALTSAFVETLPVTAMMVKVVVSLVEKKTLGLPLQPLVWAIAFGPCLGGNGTLYGSSANIVCADIAEQHGYLLSFKNFFKIGFPMMIGSVLVTTVYLLFAHVLFQWH